MKVVRLLLFITMGLLLVMVSYLLQRGLGPTFDILRTSRQRTFQATRLSTLVARHYAGKRLLSVLRAEHAQLASSPGSALPDAPERGDEAPPRRGLLRGVSIELQATPRAPHNSAQGEAVAGSPAALQLWDVRDASMGRWSALDFLDLLEVEVRVLDGKEERAHLTSSQGILAVGASRLTLRSNVELRSGARVLRAAEAVWDGLTGSLHIPGAFTLEGAHGMIRGRNLKSDLTLSRLQFLPAAAAPDAAPAPQ
ncbi:MAG: hypothetical protein HYY96_10390 [Candidatus Tectomicrobia bacterium]|nr:hypothetical protein [Candidatus Tectomicrobia bacterium]